MELAVVLGVVEAAKCNGGRSRRFFLVSLSTAKVVRLRLLQAKREFSSLVALCGCSGLLIRTEVQVLFTQQLKRLLLCLESTKDHRESMGSGFLLRSLTRPLLRC